MAARIGVTMSTTLDGVVQGLGRPNEDTRGGFSHGGWGDGYADHVQGAFMAERMSGRGRCCSATAPTSTCSRTGRP